MKNKKYTVRILSALICAILLIGAFLGVCVSAEGHSAEDYDLSRDGSSHNKVLNSADILERILDEELSFAERAYLVSYGDLSVCYDDGITTEKVSVLLNDRSLTVNAFTYSYESVSGSLVNWIPKSAELDGVVKPLSKEGEAYVASFDGIFEGSGVERVNVLYTLSVHVSEDDVYDLINKAKNDIPLVEQEIVEKTAEYERAFSEFKEKEKSYSDYLLELSEYEEALEEYDEYLREYRLYSERLSLYNEYLIDMEAFRLQLIAREKYEKDLEDYKNNYPLYVVYQQEKKEYDLAFAEYTAYVESVGRFTDRLKIVDYSAVVMTPLKRSALAAINGNVVTSVLAERDSLESSLVGAPPKVIDLAGEATDNLRILLNDYFSYTTEQGRYTYYQQNYTAIRDNFVNLFIALDHLYKNSSVRAVLYETERDEKYRILVAQLYLIAHALSDEPIKSVSRDMVEGSKDADKYKQFTYTSNFTMDVYKYTIKDILGETELLADNNSSYPIYEPFPTVVEEPIAPVPVEKPIEPVYVAEPTEVNPVDPAGDPPQMVEDPGDPPSPVAPAGDAPKEYIPPSEYVDLLAVKDELSLREIELTDGYDLVIEKTVSKKFIDPDEVNVKFYSENGAVLLYETTVDSGTAADYHGVIPTKPEDDRAVYRFDGWKNSEGVRVSLSSVSSDLNLYPCFSETIKSYTVSFNVDGKLTEYTLAYGSLPSYGESTPKRADTDTVFYTFSGWDKEIVPLTANTEYVAVFASEYIVPTSQGGASVRMNDGLLTVDFGFCFDRVLNIGGAVKRAAQYGAMRIITPYLTVDISFSEVVKLANEDPETMKIEVTETAGSLRYYKLTLTNSDLEEINGQFNVKVTDKSVNLVNNERLKLFSVDDAGSRKYAKFTLDGKKMEFSCTLGSPYTLAYEYTVTVAADSKIGLSAGSELNSISENVVLSMSLPDNMRIVRLYYIDSEGNEKELDVLRFSMPASDVTVVAETEYIRYKISFVSEGTVISSFYCTKGEMPEIPEAPKKLSDENNSYVFKGWSEEVGVADGDKTYVAVFEAVPIVEDTVEDQGMTIYQKATLIAAIALGVFVILLAAIIAAKINS